MTMWRYIAVSAGDGEKTRGERSGATAAEVRASLRRIGLQVVDLKPVRERQHAGHSGVVGASFQKYLRNRRQGDRSELYDSLATMLESGLPLLEAVSTLAQATTTRGSGVRSVLVQIRDNLRSGLSLSEAMGFHPGWFDNVELAMVRASELGGTLPGVLRTLSDRHQRAGELTHKLMAALTYPAVITVVGLGVVVFLSVKTLPDLTQILVENEIAVPALTERVMAFGQFMANRWLVLAFGVPVLGFIFLLGLAWLKRRGLQPPEWTARLRPLVLRRMAVAGIALRLAELVRCGVPITEALRVIAPTTPGNVLPERLIEAAQAVERGAELSEAFSDSVWFDAEFRRLLDIGQRTGELETLLERIGERYTRRSSRLIDRLTTLLEPTVILLLATLIGIVAMAAVLPLIRLQEVLS